MKTLTPQELKKLIDDGVDMLILDTRPEDEYLRGHIPGAKNIPQLMMPAMLDQIDPTKKVILYCTYGVKSDQPYIYLKDKLKIKDLNILDGGIYKYSIEIDPEIVC